MFSAEAGDARFLATPDVPPFLRGVYGVVTDWGCRIVQHRGPNGDVGYTEEVREVKVEAHTPLNMAFFWVPDKWLEPVFPERAAQAAYLYRSLYMDSRLMEPMQKVHQAHDELWNALRGLPRLDVAPHTPLERLMLAMQEDDICALPWEDEPKDATLSVLQTAWRDLTRAAQAVVTVIESRLDE